MNELDATNYKNGRKNNWRNWQWNCARQYIANPSEAIVLYLPGSTDLDRPVAIRKGFKEANLIAIERDTEVTKLLRAKGVTTINDDLLKVINAWPSDIKVGLVIADMVTGLDLEATALIAPWIGSPPFWHSVLSLNAMRGREMGNISRMYIKMLPTVFPNFFKSYDLSTKHRGALALLSCAFTGPMALSTEVGDEARSMGRPGSAWHAWLNEHIISKGGMRALFDWHFNSYTSNGNVRFDSVVMRCNIPRVANEDLQGYRRAVLEVNPSLEPTMKRISAALAIRTRRLRGEL